MFLLQAYESGVVANTEEAMGEYVKALVRLDALDGSRLAATLQRGAESSFAARGLASANNYMPPPAAASQAGSNLPWYAQGPQFGGGGGGGGGLSGAAAAALAAAGVSNANSSGGGDLGSQRNPLVITQAEPSLMAQVCRC
jgi:ATP-dependent metalloprotease